MKLYEFRNDTYFPSARLRIHTDYVFTHFLAFEEVTEPHRLRKNTSFRLPPHYEISRIAQAYFLLISETSPDFIYSMSSSNNPRTKLGYDRGDANSNFEILNWVFQSIFRSWIAS